MSANTLKASGHAAPGDGDLRAAQLRVLFNGMPITIATHIAGGLLFLALFWPGGQHRQLLIWYGLLLATVVCRAVLLVRYRQYPPAPYDHILWLSLFLIGVLASATVWGGMMFISPWYGHGIDNLIKALFLCGLLAGAMMSLSVWKWAFMAFAMPATLPVIYGLLAGHGQLELLVALCFCIMVFFLFLHAEKTEDAFARNHFLQARNADLIDSLHLEQEKVRQNLAHSEEKYAKIFQSSPVPMSISGMINGAIVDINESFLEFSGYRRDELVGNNAQELRFWVDEAARNSFFSKLQAEGQVKNLEARFRVRSGAILHCLVSGESIHIDSQPHLLAMVRNITHERQMSEQLRLSEEKFSKAFKSLPDPIAISRLSDGMLVDVNDSCLAVSGYTREELIGRNAFDIGVWEDPAQRETVVRKLAAHGSVRNEEADFVRKDGGITHCLISIEIINIYGVPHMLVLTRDITLQKQAQSGLHVSEARFRQLVENMREGLGITDTQGRITYVNDRICDMLKMHRDLIVGRQVTDFVDENSLKAIQKRLADRARGLYAPYELTWIAEGGAKVITWITPSPIYDAQGKLEGSFAIVSDITRRREAEESLRLSEQRFRYAFRYAPIGIALVGREGVIVQCNPLCHEVLGYREDELVGSSIAEITHPDDIESSASRFQQLMSGECDHYQIESRYRRKTGGYMQVRLSATALPGRDGRPHYGIYHVEVVGKEEEDGVKATKAVRRKRA